MKYILLSFCVPLSLFCSGQNYFTLTSDGFSSTEDPTKNYIVLTDSARSKEELYKAAVLYMNKIYRSPKDVMSPIENESLTVNGIADNSIHRNSMHVFDLNYTITFEFKDGRIKVNAPGFKLTTYTHTRQEIFLTSGSSLDGSRFGIYTTSGKLRLERTKSELEKFFNAYISAFDAALKEKKSEDW